MFMRKAYLKFIKENYPPIESGNDAYATHANRLEHLSKQLQQNFEALKLIDGKGEISQESIKSYRGLLDYWMAFLRQYKESLPSK